MSLMKRNVEWIEKFPDSKCPVCEGQGEVSSTYEVGSGREIEPAYSCPRKSGDLDYLYSGDLVTPRERLAVARIFDRAPTVPDDSDEFEPDPIAVGLECVQDSRLGSTLQRKLGSN